MISILSKTDCFSRSIFWTCNDCVGFSNILALPENIPLSSTIYGLISAVFYDVVHHKEFKENKEREIGDIFERNIEWYY